MKKLALLPLAAMVFVAACSDSSQAPTETFLQPGNPLKDEVANNLDGSIDAVAEVMSLNIGGTAGTTILYVVAKNGDGKNGCNLTGSTALGLSVASSDPSKATVSPSSVTFTSCSDTKTLTITPVAVGSATISVSQTSNTTGGTFDLTGARFSVNVAPPANTAPTISVTDVTGGASYNKGSVPAAMCQVTDAEDGPQSFAATLSGVLDADGLGSQRADCSYTDRGGLLASASEAYSIIDPSAPIIGSTLSPASPDGDNGWYKGTVSLAWTVTEAESPNSLNKTGCVDQNITVDQAETAYSCSAQSSGGPASPAEVKIKRDATAPTISGTAATTRWTKNNVAVTFACSDATSGVATCGPNTTVSTEGANQSVQGTATDRAGNTGNTIVSNINIDKTAPTISLSGGVENGATYYFGSVPAAPTCTASDELSGLNGSCSVTGHSTAVGSSHTVTASAVDNAGNRETVSVTYSVLAWTPKGFYQPVNMSALNTVKAGATVPLKFEIFAGATELISVGAITSFKTAVIPCSDASAAGEDPVDITSTGGTSLRYDATEGQFIQNWATPKAGAGKCYRVTVAMGDGSVLVGNFGLK